jgi:sulfatase modifying factor 1
MTMNLKKSIPLDEDIEEIELDDDEEIEEIEIDDEDDLEEIEIDEDEELETVDDDELEEIDSLDEDIEEIELDDDEEIEEIEIDDEDDLEEIEIDEDEELETVDDDELEEIDSLDEDIEEIELDDDEEIETVDDDELEEIDSLDEDIEEIELDDDEEIEELDIDDDEEIEEIDGDLEALDEDERKALDEYRQKKELAEHFDQALGEREKKYNKYTRVPAGQYTIGSKKGLKQSLELQQFTMPEVYIGIYPITNALFEVFIEETGYVTTAEKTGFGRVYTSNYKRTKKGSDWQKKTGSQDIAGACWFQPSGPGSSLHGKRNHPVVQVSVDDAVAFASWIGRRLPTEAEWEAAARTDLGYVYPWGDTFNLEALNIEKTGIADTSEVNRYDSFANEFGIADMLGNVMEWTSDTQIPPVESKKNIPFCVAKGAAWNAKDSTNISSRALFKPGFSSNTIGFRCTSEIYL